MKKRMIEVQPAISIDSKTGMIMNGMTSYMASIMVYRAEKADRIIINDAAFLMNIALYDQQVPEEYMYTYMYEPEQNWSVYTGEYSEDSFSGQDYIFQKECYFRVCLKKEDNSECTLEDAERIQDIITFYSSHEEEAQEKIYFEQEIIKTTDSIQEKMGGEKALLFALLSDSHWTVNGTWEDTIGNIRKVHEKVGFDGIIHLGDLQDGLLDKRMCRRIASKCINDMRAICEPVYLTIGNHDTNYFRKNPDWLNQEEQYGIYGRFNDRYVSRERNNAYYYVDYTNCKLRMIFLTSFDHKNAIRYGFPMEEVMWVEKILHETPEGFQILVFSHDAPLAVLDYWANEIRNGDNLMKVLEEYHRTPGRNILGYIHGHTHADYIYKERSFPIISVGCSKCEYFPDKKPEGAIRQMRKLNDVTQELWEALIIVPEKKKLEFIRFGAGEDRKIEQKVKVWAHRGASAYAPENTLEAFRLAAEMGADGIELDVQLTKDGEIVVTHDEKIDRVSDGNGLVADHTLEELRSFNFNKTHSEYTERCQIPTLREVLECLQNTKMTVNIEIKTGVRLYPELEKKTVELVQEMGYENRVLYSSFNHQSVLKVKEYQPNAQIAFLYSHALKNVAGYARMNGIYAVNPSVFCSRYEEEMQECIQNNIDLHVWTVNSEKEMRRLVKLGVSAIITNYPDMGRRVVDE